MRNSAKQTVSVVDVDRVLNESRLNNLTQNYLTQVKADLQIELNEIESLHGLERE